MGLGRKGTAAAAAPWQPGAGAGKRENREIQPLWSPSVGSVHSVSHRASLFISLHIRHELSERKTKTTNKSTEKKIPNPTNFQWEFCEQRRSSVPGAAGPCTSPANKNKKYIYIFNFSPFLPPTAKLGKAGSPQVEKHHLFRCIYLNLSLCIKRN